MLAHSPRLSGPSRMSIIGNTLGHTWQDSPEHAEYSSTPGKTLHGSAVPYDTLWGKYDKSTLDAM